jgi:hypothetical protein
MKKFIVFIFVVTTFFNVYSNEIKIKKVSRHNSFKSEMFSFKIKFGKDSNFNKQKPSVFLNNVPLNKNGLGFLLPVGIPLFAIGCLGTIIGIPFLAVGAVFMNRPSDETLDYEEATAFLISGAACLGTGLVVLTLGSLFLFVL